MKSKFKLFDAILAMVCVILVTEACAPTAAIGNSQYFWWLILLIFFFVPYGLVSCELGTTYPDERGIFTWIERSFGFKWASRVAYYYWVNFPIWIASIAVLFVSTIEQMFSISFSLFGKLSLETFFITLVCILGVTRLSKHKILINIGTIFKVILMLGIGALGIYIAITKGSANSFNVNSFFPKFNLKELSFISVIIFNFIGFEVVATFQKQVSNPKKQFPKIILVSGFLIALFYIIASFGLSVAIPLDKLSLDTGLLESYQILLGIGNNNIIMIIIGFMFIVTIFVSILSWTEGVNIECSSAAKSGGLPKIFAYKDKNNNLIGASFVTWITAIIIILTELLIKEKDMFWNFFALNLITLLLTYLPMFLAFKKLRKKDYFRIRPYRVPGNKFVINLITYIPTALLVITILLTMLPTSFTLESFYEKVPIIIGTIIAIIIGEVLILVKRK